MNTRDYKESSKGEYYHIYNRGNSKNDIFLNSEDYNFFLLRLHQNLFPEENKSLRIQPLPPESFSLVGYCLMPNHFHLLIQQKQDISTSKLLSKLTTSYSKYFNKKYDRVGHLFQDRFKQVNISDNEYLKWLSCYIHQNPTIAKLVDKPEDYKWSSYNYYIEKQGRLICETDIILDQFNGAAAYKKFVESSYEIIKSKRTLEYILLD